MDNLFVLFKIIILKTKNTKKIKRIKVRKLWVNVHYAQKMMPTRSPEFAIRDAPPLRACCWQWVERLWRRDKS